MQFRPDHPIRPTSRKPPFRLARKRTPEDVTIYAVGPGAELVAGTVKNAHIFHVMKRALALR